MKLFSSTALNSKVRPQLSLECSNSSINWSDAKQEALWNPQKANSFHSITRKITANVHSFVHIMLQSPTFKSIIIQATPYFRERLLFCLIWNFYKYIHTSNPQILVIIPQTFIHRSFVAVNQSTVGIFGVTVQQFSFHILKLVGISLLSSHPWSQSFTSLMVDLS